LAEATPEPDIALVGLVIEVQNSTSSRILIYPLPAAVSADASRSWAATLYPSQIGLP
jgi:cell shape-determining protein MreC